MTALAPCIYPEILEVEKPQLARLTAKPFCDEGKETSRAILFVMTLNAESSETLLESYVSFALQTRNILHCLWTTRLLWPAPPSM